VGQEENAAAAKKSTVSELDDDGTSRGICCWFGGGVGKSPKAPEKKAAVFET
jgi:hypothetical protein